MTETQTKAPVMGPATRYIVFNFAGRYSTFRTTRKRGRAHFWTEDGAKAAVFLLRNATLERQQAKEGLG